jgi:hypothetical protein
MREKEKEPGEESGQHLSRNMAAALLRKERRNYGY